MVSLWKWHWSTLLVILLCCPNLAVVDEESTTAATSPNKHMPNYDNSKLFKNIIQAPIPAHSPHKWSIFANSDYRHQPALLSEHWLPTTFPERVHYFTLFELCMVETNNDKALCISVMPAGARQIRRQRLGDWMEQCSVNAGGIGHINSICPNLPNAFLRYHTSHPFPHSKGSVDTITLMLKHHIGNTLLLIGDSLTGQQSTDLACNLYRVGFPYVLFEGNTDVILQDPNEGKSHFNQTQYDLHQNDPSMHPYDYTPYFQTRWIGFNKLESLPLEALNTTLVNIIQSKARRVTGRLVIVLNIGVHYNLADHDRYVEDLKSLLLYLDDISKAHNALVIFRETTAQHFNTPTGGYNDNITTSMVFFARNSEKLVENRLVASGLKRVDKGPPLMTFVRAKLDRETLADDANISYATGRYGDLRLKQIDDEECEKQSSDGKLRITEKQHADSYSGSAAPDKKLDGYFYSVDHGALVVPELQYCRPILSEAVKEANNWRNKVLYGLVKEHALSRIHVAKFFDATLPRHDLHLRGADCTHFCNTPMIWLPLWKEIYDIIAKVASG